MKQRSRRFLAVLTAAGLLISSGCSRGTPWIFSGSGTGQDTAAAVETKSDETVSETIEEPQKQPIPESYDLRENGKCPPAEDQGEFGTCWAFSALSALESFLLPDRPYDFSEDHMTMHNSFGREQTEGGDDTMALAYLLSWQGPVLEEDDPYGDGISPDGLSAVIHVKEVRFLPAKDYEAIKRAILTYGAVQSVLYTEMADGNSYSPYYNIEAGSYYYPGTEESNHDVVIIGWDDTYSRENFVVPPEHDGAFLCLNSWGTGFGDRGAFYVSYDDTRIGSFGIVYTGAEPAREDEAIYQTDERGWTGQMGYGDEDAWFANRYLAKEKETLTGVGFYALKPGTEYEVYVVHNAPSDGKFNLSAPLAKGTLQEAGFYTIQIGEQQLEKGEPFALAVKIHSPGSTHPVAVTDNSIQIQGTGYLSADGKNWIRSEELEKHDICLKGYTRRGE